MSFTDLLEKEDSEYAYVRAIVNLINNNDIYYIIQNV